MKAGIILGIAMLAAAAQAESRADAPVQLVNQVFLERISRGADGAQRVVLMPAGRYSSGDRLVFITRYRNDSSLPVRGYVVANPVPSDVRVDPPAGATVEVSVDGGRRWGPLQALTVGTRRATPDDITHVRWIFGQAMAPGETGQISYRGTAR